MLEIGTIVKYVVKFSACDQSPLPGGGVIFKKRKESG